MKAHKGAPPIGWENVPGLPGYIREKAAKRDDGELLSIMRALAEREMAKSLGEMEKVKGEEGKQGRDGPVGPEGPTGRDGKPGRDGRDGKDGLAGSQGEKGAKGDKGPVGPEGKAGKPGQDGKDGKEGTNGVGIADVKAYGNDLQIKLTDGRVHKFRVSGGGSSVTAFGGGRSSLEAGVGIDIAGEVISIKRTWTDYATRWDAEPALTGTASTPAAGDVYAYILGGVTRYRLVPTSYAPAGDVFYGDFTGGACSGPLVARTEP
jgi:hypothetical protein